MQPIAQRINQAVLVAHQSGAEPTGLFIRRADFSEACGHHFDESWESGVWHGLAVTFIDDGFKTAFWLVFTPTHASDPRTFGFRTALSTSPGYMGALYGTIAQDYLRHVWIAEFRGHTTIIPFDDAATLSEAKRVATRRFIDKIEGNEHERMERAWGGA